MGIINRVLAFLGLRTPSVDAALGALTRAQRKLHRAAEAHENKAVVLHGRASVMFAQSNLAAQEAERANRVARKIEELVE